MTSCMRMLKITSALFYCIHFKNTTKQAMLSSLLLPSYLKVPGFKIRFLEILTVHNDWETSFSLRKMI